MESSNDSQSKLVPHEPIVADNRKGFHSSDTSLSGGSGRYGVSGGFYRGSHMFNGVTEFSSKRSAGRGSQSPNSHHGGSFSPQTVGSSSRPVRDAGEGRYRRPFKSFTTDDAVIPNHATGDGKHIRILQRPLPSAGKLQSESGRSDDADDGDKISPDALRQQQQLLKRGHRKKTLSLNPEEREALENLVEEVIIDGLGEAIIDSDGSSSDDDDHDAKENHSEPTHRPDSNTGKDSRFDDAKDGRLNNDKGSLRDSGAAGDKHQSAKNLGRNIGRNNGRDFNRRGREAVSSTKGVKDVKRSTDIRQTKVTPPEEDKEKPNAATVRGVNIYPAQLKVAIKHMDSLPPRFLRRLQTGSSRTAGNESILACLTMKPPSDGVQPAGDAVRSDDASISPTDRDRGKAKQNQLQETKKTIRNLLCDLDQYTDETVMKEYYGGGHASMLDKPAAGPVLPDNSGEALAAGMPVYYGQPYGNRPPPYANPEALQPGVPSPSQTLKQQSFSFLAAAPQSAGPRMLSCEEIEREMLHGSVQAQATSPGAPESSSMPPVEVAGNMPPFYPPPSQVGQMAPPMSQAQQQQQPKKSQFSVDAPEFVSSYYMANRAVSKQVPIPPSVEPFYAGPPPPVHNTELGVQILQENVHLPAKQAQYPVSVMPPPTLPHSVSAGQEFADMPPGTAVAPSSYEMLQYDQMSAQGMGMLRSTQQYIAPASVQMPLSVSGQGDGVSPVMEMDAMGYPAYQYVPGNNAYSTGYAPGAGFSQTAQPSYMPMPVPAGPTMSSPNWIADRANQSQMSAAGWYQEYPGMPYANPSLGGPRQAGFEETMYAAGVTSAYSDQPMMNSVGVDKWSYAARAVIDAGRQKVQQLLSEGTCVMVILIGGPEADNLSLVSDLTVSSNGAWVLNTRNGMCNGNTGKMMQMQEWNVKQVADALEARKNPIIIDNTFSQQWERDRYMKMAEMAGYAVEIIDSTNFASTAPPCVARPSVPGGDVYGGQQLAGGDVYRGQPAMPAAGYQGYVISKDAVNAAAAAASVPVPPASSI